MNSNSYTNVLNLSLFLNIQCNFIDLPSPARQLGSIGTIRYFCKFAKEIDFQGNDTGSINSDRSS